MTNLCPLNYINKLLEGANLLRREQGTEKGRGVMVKKKNNLTINLFYSSFFIKMLYSSQNLGLSLSLIIYLCHQFLQYFIL